MSLTKIANRIPIQVKKPIITGKGREKKRLRRKILTKALAEGQEEPVQASPLIDSIPRARIHSIWSLRLQRRLSPRAWTVCLMTLFLCLPLLPNPSSSLLKSRRVLLAPTQTPSCLCSTTLRRTTSLLQALLAIRILPFLLFSTICSRRTLTLLRMLRRRASPISLYVVLDPFNYCL